jgi:hypothetical protein
MRDAGSHESTLGEVQTTLDPEFNLSVAKNALEAAGSVDSANVVGGYVTGSTAYGLALGPNTALNLNSTEFDEPSDVDLYVVVDGDIGGNPDYVSDIYDAVDDFNSANPDNPEVNPGVVRVQKLRGCLAQGGEDLASSGDTAEYVKIDAPQGDDILYYSEFVKSLSTRVPIGGIENSRVERDIKAGEHLVSSNDPQGLEFDDSYMEEVCEERGRLLRENEALGNELREARGTPELPESRSGIRYKTAIANILRDQIGQQEVPRIADGSFSELHLDPPRHRSVEDYVLDKIEGHPAVDVDASGPNPSFSFGSVKFSDKDLELEELLTDALKGKLGKAIDEGSVRRNPHEMEIDDICGSPYKDVTGFGS